jgi:predicted SprT family Zn-dependent metalloprotease
MKLIETFNSLMISEKYKTLVDTIRKSYPNFYNESLIEDILDWVEKSGVKSVSFERLTMAAGVAHYDKLILNSTNVHLMSFCMFIYVLLHETSHYYQFKKHGNEIEYDIYNNDNIDEIADNLLSVEVAADRLALMKFKQLKNKYNIDCNTPESQYMKIKNKSIKDKDFYKYINFVRNAVMNKEVNNSRELVDLAYNTIKG